MQLFERGHQKSQERWGEMACVEVYVFHAHKTQHRLRNVPWLWFVSPNLIVWMRLMIMKIQTYFVLFAFLKAIKQL